MVQILFVQNEILVDPVDIHYHIQLLIDIFYHQYIHPVISINLFLIIFVNRNKKLTKLDEVLLMHSKK